jgi:hypothetical protein
LLIKNPLDHVLNQQSAINDQQFFPAKKRRPAKAERRLFPGLVRAY